MKDKIMGFLTEKADLLGILLIFISAYMLGFAVKSSKFYDKIDDLTLFTMQMERSVSEMENHITKQDIVIDKISKENKEKDQIIRALIIELEKRKHWLEVDPDEAI